MGTTITVLASAWSSMFYMFSGVFTKPSFELFVRFASGWVLCTGRHTISGIYPFAEPNKEHAHDAYHRFVSGSAWQLSALWKVTACFLVKKFFPEGKIRFDIDDTLFHKSGRKVEGAGWWRDAVRSTSTKTVHALGLNFVVMSLRVTPPWGGEPLGLPVNVRLHRKNGTDLLKLAEEMIRELREWFPDRPFDLCGDGFYAVLAGRRIPNIHWTTRLRCDAAIYDLPPESKGTKKGRPKKKGMRLPTPKQLASMVKKWSLVETQERGKTRMRLIYVRPVLWYSVCKDTPVLLIISRDPEGREKDDFFITTDLSKSGAEVVGMYAGRWSIEDTNKNTKQYLRCEEPQTWRRDGPEKAGTFGLWLYSMIWAWYLLYAYRKSPIKRLPWYAGKQNPSFQDALGRLRGCLWRERIFSRYDKNLVPVKKVEQLMEALEKAA